MVNQEIKGTHPSGKPVHLITLEGPGQCRIQCLNLGGVITRWEVPDRDGNVEDVVLGFDRWEDYIQNEQFFGAIIGRYANRIAFGKFLVDGKEFNLACNNGPHHLHGGPGGLGRVVWDFETWSEEDSQGVTFLYKSPDGEEGYPGNLTCWVTYTLANDHSLTVSYQAQTDRNTIVNLTQHTYFNLTGDFSRVVDDHEFQIDADSFTPVDQTLLPTGDISSVNNTPLDLRSPIKLGDLISNGIAQGFDHNFVLNQTDQAVASAHDPFSGRMLEVFTSEPGLQFYTGNSLDESPPGKGGVHYQPRTGFCFETQHFPDSPNRPNFPSVVVTPEKPYQSQTIFKFLTK